MNLQTHTNENLPSDLRVSRKGDLLVIQARTATIHLYWNKRDELVAALKALG